ncbi:2-amino-4-hydroxy-6-hydroxymethyldihydropteridine diphosphokinase [Fulvivirga sp. RKSG066]|uniref:2-amino-4-hydroxy-6- hydroxymethyldihydropteridine diphosphokinase n=1 Tax=Fulvivirga aurantia TaxID=2529383 RepID=UPI0012BD7894|nr:2-amino-4-hydroxy-6-hydroxymethyldihydropteridine diphosphokinase [Fulvivirga aurantia]MTI22173.1 2-amino-4-hydroxy-6-hydroxymethyldihydropteridine diphosphokinase [Fulvivirga aurantia]
MIDGIYLLLGTNLGDKKMQLSLAKTAISEQIGEIRQESSIYETAAWGKTDQPSFLNQVVEICSDLDPVKMLEVINTIEQKMGRLRQEKWGERLIDIDILYYKNQICNEPDLQIPHPGIPNRRFTLVPLVELAPNFKHPVLNKTNTELLHACEDDLEVAVV